MKLLVIQANEFSGTIKILSQEEYFSLKIRDPTVNGHPLDEGTEKFIEKLLGGKSLTFKRDDIK